MVTIAGVVMDIDKQVPAVGIRVSQLGTSYSDAVATGTDGAFEIKVPKGTPLALRTDDFYAGRTNKWVPLINVDWPNVVANRDMLDELIHACPFTQCATSPDTSGSVAIWDVYLQEGDQNNGDMFVPTSTAIASGTIVISIWTCDNGQASDVPGFSVTSNVPEFPFCYINKDKLFFPDFALCSNGLDFVFPPSQTSTDDWGHAYSWGDPAYTGNSVKLTMTDTDPQRGLDWQSPFEVPVRPGEITLIQPSAIDSVPNRSLVDVLKCLGYL
jgi:hypothetical protein